MPICNCGKPHCDWTTPEYAEMWRCGNEDQRARAAALTQQEVHQINQICFVIKQTERMRAIAAAAQQLLQQLQQQSPEEPADGA